MMLGALLGDDTPFLGDNLIVWLLLALGGALFVGNVMALLRPPEIRKSEEDLRSAPRSRSILMAGIGFVVVVAAIGGLLKG
ncbi:MAG: hypothetical protein ABIR68_14535 [Ilumatobacteraceae bacterium]